MENTDQYRVNLNRIIERNIKKCGHLLIRVRQEQKVNVHQGTLNQMHSVHCQLNIHVIAELVLGQVISFAKEK